MASDLYLTVFDPRRRCVVRRRWLGGSATIARAHEVLEGRPRVASTEHDCWGGIALEDVVAIAEQGYVGGIGESELASYANKFPPGDQWWMIERWG